MNDPTLARIHQCPECGRFESGLSVQRISKYVLCPWCREHPVCQYEPRHDLDESNDEESEP